MVYIDHQITEIEMKKSHVHAVMLKNVQDAVYISIFKHCSHFSPSNDATNLLVCFTLKACLKLKKHHNLKHNFTTIISNTNAGCN